MEPGWSGDVRPSGGGSDRERHVAEDQASAAAVSSACERGAVRLQQRRGLGGGGLAQGARGAGVGCESGLDVQPGLLGGAQVDHGRLLGFGGQQRRLVDVVQQRARGRGSELGLLRLVGFQPLGLQLAGAVLVAVRRLQLAVRRGLRGVAGNLDRGAGVFLRVDLHLGGLGVSGTRGERRSLGVERCGLGGHAEREGGSESCQGVLQFHGGLQFKG